jgi:hypothetical protein
MRALIHKAGTHFGAGAGDSIAIVKCESVALMEGEGEMTNGALRPRQPDRLVDRRDFTLSC